MEQTHESTLVRARALLAIIAPASGASEGERRNAADALARHMERHRLTDADLADNRRTWREMSLVPRGHGLDLKLSKDMLILAIQIARYVIGTQEIEWDGGRAHYKKPMRGGKEKWILIYTFRAWVTDAEFTDLCDCYRHHAPQYLCMLKDLADAKKRTMSALKKAPSAYCTKFRLFPPDAKSGGRMNDDEHAALMTAYAAARGERWTKKAGYLEGAEA